MSISMNNPGALQRLKTVDYLIVKQHPSLLEALTGYQPSTAFSIYNRDEELLFNAFEESTCWQRCCCINSRELTIRFRDADNNEVIKMTRALKCCCVCCWCGDCDSCKQEMVVESPPGTVIEVVAVECNLLCEMLIIQIRCTLLVLVASVMGIALLVATMNSL